MKVSIIQSDIAWEDKQANFNKYESLVEDLKGKTDLVILPEMFSTGFSMNSSDLAEEMTGPTLRWMRAVSANGDFGLMGSFIARERENFYNRLVFMKPDGSYSSYDKGHLFRMEKENMFFTKGRKAVIDSFLDCRFSLQICYDLRFPVWSRIRNNSYDVLVYLANWPASRRNVWNTLLVARAIENQCYVIGANRTGKDENGLEYTGDSVIIDPKGKILAETDINKEEILSAEISVSDLRKFREKFPVWLDADDFTLHSD